MITRYSFGVMEIEGHVYRKDVIVLPDGSIHCPWWRASGHVLTSADIEPVWDCHPAVLVVGTGDSGMMEPDETFVREVEGRGIRLIVLPTAQAVQEFNKISGRGASCAGCFHLCHRAL